MTVYHAFILTDDEFMRSETIEELKRIYIAQKEQDIGLFEYPLVKAPFGFEEILEGIKVLLSGRVTMGQKVKQFEDAFAKYIGVKHAIMVNSGSSANLIAMSIISNPSIKGSIKLGAKVIVPALSWSTSVFPIVDVGAVPTFVDSNLETLNLSIESLQNCITPDVKAILTVHLLGNPCDMKELKEIAIEHDLFLIEDCCEAHGAKFGGRKVGAIGDIGTFSFYFSHHISTIEGGMVVTDNEEFAELARVLRAHGWTRNLKNRSMIEEKHKERDPRFLFVNRGYNFRPTEIQGVFGLHQISKIDNYVERRRRVATILGEELKRADLDISLQIEQKGGEHSWFGFPIILKSGDWEQRRNVIEKLHSRGIETRVVMGGNMAVQPANAMFDYATPVKLDIASHVDRSGILIGLHADLQDDDAHKIASRIIQVLQTKN